MNTAFRIFCHFSAFMNTTIVVAAAIMLVFGNGSDALRNCFDIIVYSLLFIVARCQFNFDALDHWWRTGKIMNVSEGQS